MSYLGAGSPRRRRSRRHRRLRRVRIAAVLATFLGVVLAAWFLSRHTSRSSAVPEADNWSEPAAPDYAKLASQIRIPRQARIPRYPIYNYSVVRGGVHSVEELRQAIAHDRAVAAHYAKFQYERARLVRLQKPALVYLSYRMNEKIYWTKTRHKLKAGEELITDGTIAARTKCANQVSSRKQLAVSAEEPPAALLEQAEPAPLLPPAETHFPALYKTALVSNPPITPGPWAGPTLGPIGLPIGDPPIGPRGHKPVCEPAWQERHEEKLGIHDDENKEIHCPPKHHKPPAAVPEPATVLLMGSGLAAVYGAYRKRKITA